MPTTFPLRLIPTVYKGRSSDSAPTFEVSVHGRLDKENEYQKITEQDVKFEYTLKRIKHEGGEDKVAGDPITGEVAGRLKPTGAKVKQFDNIPVYTFAPNAAPKPKDPEPNEIAVRFVYDGTLIAAENCRVDADTALTVEAVIKKGGDKVARSLVRRVEFQTWALSDFSVGTLQAAGPGTKTTRAATYNWWAGNEVQLYNDASEDADGNKGAFKDLLDAIDTAKHFIFICDWSFHPGFKLSRKGRDPDENKSIGEVLIRQAVKYPKMVIAIHTWHQLLMAGGGPLTNDPINNDGNRALDEIAKGLTNLKKIVDEAEQDAPALTKRPPNLLWRASKRAGHTTALTTHHQKFVVLDAPIGNIPKEGQAAAEAEDHEDLPEREIIVFFGGLDLTKGRFDWPEHHILPKVDGDKPYVQADIKDHKGDTYLKSKDKAGDPWGSGPAWDKLVKYNDWYNGEFYGLTSETWNPKTGNYKHPDNAGEKVGRLLPREPWHDIHCQLRGPAAWDFVYEFAGRWNRDPAATHVPLTGSDKKFTDIGSKGDTDNEAIDKVMKKLEWLRNYRQTDPGEPGTRNRNTIMPQFSCHSLFKFSKKRPWAAQVYRSIVRDHWGPPPKAVVDKLPWTKVPDGCSPDQLFEWPLRETYERSIHDAYVHAIQRAQRFLYMESQYFIGTGSHKNWVNHIPEAIVDRIRERAKEAKPFHAYIVLPAFPEGDPDSSIPPLTAIRIAQWETIRWMVSTLHKEKGIGDRWAEYLSFYFPFQWGDRGVPYLDDDGNHVGVRAKLKKGETVTIDGREFKSLEDKALPSWLSDTADDLERRRQIRVLMSERYMIYVHSKFMIIDDQYVIVGSANCNERSMAGNRDTEICVGMWPDHGQEDACKKEVQAFRERLWKEHLGEDNLPADWKDPEKKGCWEKVQKVGADLFELMLKGKRGGAKGHLCMWPLRFDPRDGKIYFSLGTQRKAKGGHAPHESYIPDREELMGVTGTNRDKWKWEPKEVTFGSGLEATL
jgi:phospholipase D1/2